MNASLHYADALSFMRIRQPKGTGIVHWCVEPTGDYTEDCEIGRRLATEYLDFIGGHPTVCHATLLNCIVHEIHKNAANRSFTGVEVGFFREVNEFAMTAAIIRTRHRPRETEEVADPLIDLIQRYREGQAAYSAAMPEDDEADDVAQKTYFPPMEALAAWDQPATSKRGALEALKLAEDERQDFYRSPVAAAMTKAALGYLEGRHNHD